MKTLFFSLLLIVSAQVFAQDSLSVKPFPKNTIFVGLFQETITLNYDRIVYEKNKFKLSLRGGISIMPYTVETYYDDDDSTMLIKLVGLYERVQTTKWNEPTIRIPLEISFLYGKNKHFVEFSLGYTLATGMRKTYSLEQREPLESDRLYFGRGKVYLGYRRQASTGLFWKIGLVLHSNNNNFDLHDTKNRAIFVSPFNTMSYLNYMANYSYLLVGIGKSFGK